jgi:putative ABC transport system substrate-binding protein
MHRREFLLGGAAAAWPLAAHAQQRDDIRRIGFLIGLPAEDADGQARLAIFRQGLAALGWIVGRNLELAYRAAGHDPDQYRKYAQELVALAPDVLLAGGATALAALQQTTSRLPIVFANATDPAGGGYLGRVARPGRNTTGFLNFEPRFSWKFLELLKQLAPSVTRVAVLLGATSTAMAPLMEAKSNVASPRSCTAPITAWSSHHNWIALAASRLSRWPLCIGYPRSMRSADTSLKVD